MAIAETWAMDNLNEAQRCMVETAMVSCADQLTASDFILVDADGKSIALDGHFSLEVLQTICMTMQNLQNYNSLQSQADRK